MECPKCQSENREGAKFCNECGNKLEYACPKCGNAYIPGTKFCDECGHSVAEPSGSLSNDAQNRVLTPESLTDTIPATPGHIEGERKYVTVLFSDLSGYTSLSEKFNPEELKEIMSRIFGEITQVITKYEGFIEKFVDDAVMVLFGVPKAYEDNPVRAIRFKT